MRSVRLGVGVTLSVALVTAAWAQDRSQPLQFAPEDVSSADLGAPPDAAPAPQEEDREAAPITRDAPPKKAPPPAPAPTAKSEAQKPAPPPKPEKPKKQRAQKSAPSAPSPPAVPPRVTLHVWEPEKANRFDPEETIEAAMGEVLAADSRLKFVAARRSAVAARRSAKGARGGRQGARGRQAGLRRDGSRQGQGAPRDGAQGLSEVPARARGAARVDYADARRLHRAGQRSLLRRQPGGRARRAPLRLRARRQRALGQGAYSHRR